MQLEESLAEGFHGKVVGFCRILKGLEKHLIESVLIEGHKSGIGFFVTMVASSAYQFVVALGFIGFEVVLGHGLLDGNALLRVTPFRM